MEAVEHDASTEPGMSRVSRRLEVCLPPFPVVDIIPRVTQYIQSFMYSYHPQLGGIVLGYRDLRIVKSDQLPTVDTEHYYVRFKADFTVFQPMKGLELKAEVVNRKPNEVICTYNTFKVVLQNPNGLGAAWPETEELVHGQVVLVKVESYSYNFDPEGPKLCLRGSLIRKEEPTILVDDLSSEESEAEESDHLLPAAVAVMSERWRRWKESDWFSSEEDETAETPVPKLRLLCRPLDGLPDC